MSAGGAISVFCFAAREALGEELEALTRSLPTGVEVEVAAGRVVVFYQTVDPAEFTGERGERNLQDLGWLVPRAERHQEVVARIDGQVTTLPVRFGTLFSDWRRVADWIEQRHETIEAGFNRLEGRQEWGIRLLECPRREAAEPALSASSGSSYLLMKKRLRDQEGARADRLEGLREELEREFEIAGADLMALPLRKSDHSLRRAEGDSRRTLAKWATLVRRGHIDDFVAHLDSWSERTLEGLAEIELSGPWPPYNFCPSFD
ncbi:MAG: GvpL/GvpF family gas vesicle protein [Acidobacteriota bacterium]